MRVIKSEPMNLVQFTTSNPFCVVESGVVQETDQETGDSIIIVGESTVKENHSTLSENELNSQTRTLYEYFFTYALENNFYDDLAEPK